ncbi:MAG: hypothetical protein AB1813_23240 [Verrucomicrobiota bacterium]
MKPATPKARALLAKLQALAEKGIDGERISAKHKIARLKARYDFRAQDPEAVPNLFSGRFTRSTKARPIYRFSRDEQDVANAVKWAIESATRIRCFYRDGELLTEATAPTANRLGEIADHIARCFHSLLKSFSAVEGVNLSDRAAFVRGMYDGMMNEARQAGEPLPGGIRRHKKVRGKKQGPVSASIGSHLHVHPYTLALSLGRQIRFAAPVEQITAELEAVLQQQLTAGEPSAGQEK